MSHLTDMIHLAEGDARRLTAFRQRHGQLDAEQHRFAAWLGDGLGMQFAYLARQARKSGELAYAVLFDGQAARFFDVAARDELRADLADFECEEVEQA